MSVRCHMCICSAIHTRTKVQHKTLHDNYLQVLRKVLVVLCHFLHQALQAQHPLSCRPDGFGHCLFHLALQVVRDVELSANWECVTCLSRKVLHRVADSFARLAGLAYHEVIFGLPDPLHGAAGASRSLQGKTSSLKLLALS